MPEERIDVVELLVTNESMIMRLYEVYAAKFPEYSKFWLELASEENRHAELLQKLKTAVDDGYLKLNEGRLKESTIRANIRAVESEIERSQKSDLNIISCLSTAYGIEQNLLEESFFGVLEPDSSEMREVVIQIEAETRDHSQKLPEFWNRYR